MQQQISKDTSEIPFPEFNVIRGELNGDTYESCFTEPFMAEKKCLFLSAKSKNCLVEQLVGMSDVIRNDVNAKGENIDETSRARRDINRTRKSLFGLKRKNMDQV